jgi:hypothetical protein
VARKFGIDEAQFLRHSAAEYAEADGRYGPRLAALLDWDAALKARV